MSTKAEMALIVANVAAAQVLLVAIIVVAVVRAAMEDFGFVRVSSNVLPPHLVSLPRWGGR